jgi:histidinol-phosphate/aromatic aminotransferase/cobyric acid decarboxylase-like protein
LRWQGIIVSPVQASDTVSDGWVRLTLGTDQEMDQASSGLRAITGVPSVNTAESYLARRSQP